MPPKKRSIFERLSGALPADEYDAYDDEVQPHHSAGSARGRQPINRLAVEHHEEDLVPQDEPVLEGQLPVDMFTTPNEIVIRTFVAGVRPDELSVSISRDVVEIEGARESREQVSTDDYNFQELFWGSFTRTIHLPEEIDVDAATANAKDGLLTLVLPKLDKTRQTKLKVRPG